MKIKRFYTNTKMCEINNYNSRSFDNTIHEERRRIKSDLAELKLISFTISMK